MSTTSTPTPDDDGIPRQRDPIQDAFDQTTALLRNGFILLCARDAEEYPEDWNDHQRAILHGAGRVPRDSTRTLCPGEADKQPGRRPSSHPSASNLKAQLVNPSKTEP